jgi:hypothetical protein
VLTFAAWIRYRGVASDKTADARTDTCPYSLTEVFGDDHLLNVPHQKDVTWLSEIFSRSAKKFPHLTALQVPHTGESLTFAELDSTPKDIAAQYRHTLPAPTRSSPWRCRRTTVRSSHRTGDPQGRRHIDVSRHDAADALIDHMLNDAAAGAAC